MSDIHHRVDQLSSLITGFFWWHSIIWILPLLAPFKQSWQCYRKASIALFNIDHQSLAIYIPLRQNLAKFCTGSCWHLNVGTQLLINAKRYNRIGKALRIIHHRGKTGVTMSSSTDLTVQYATGQIRGLISFDFPSVADNCCDCASMRQVTVL